MHLIDSFGKSKKLQYVCNHHEQASAIAAEGYGRVSENIGVCCVTTGPGGTNAITGIAGAWLDSIPVLCISGQVSQDQQIGDSGLRQLGVQELNIIDVIRTITKYAISLKDPTETLYHLEKAVYMAKSGRPGPVWIDVPMDIQGGFIEEEKLKHFDPAREGFVTKQNIDALRRRVSEVVKLIQSSKKPVIFAGHGIRLAKAKDIFLELAEKLQIPVLTTMSAPDLIPTANDLFVGRPGVFGDRAGNFAAQNSDLLIAIGARMHFWNISFNYKNFAGNAKKVVVDIDPAELKKKTISPDIAIEADASDFIDELMRQASGVDFPDIVRWKERCADWKKRYPVTLQEYKDEREYVNSYYFTDILSEELEEGELIVTGDGTAFTGTLQAIKIKKGQRYHCSVGCAAMGYDLPAAIGACLANTKNSRTILITGDGSIMMNLQELQTIFHYQLPIKIFLLNNGGYLAIKNTQNNIFKGHIVAADPKTGVSFPDFKKIADAFGIRYETMRTNGEAREKIRNVLASPGPVLCDISMSPTQPLYPKIQSAMKPDGSFELRPLEDMYPFLDRDEFERNMAKE